MKVYGKNLVYKNFSKNYILNLIKNKFLVQEHKNKYNRQ